MKSCKEINKRYQFLTDEHGSISEVKKQAPFFYAFTLHFKALSKSK
jgi:hypothetical protein